MTDRQGQRKNGVHEVVADDATREESSTEHEQSSQEKNPQQTPQDTGSDDHTFGLHLGEQQEREHRSKVTSTIVLSVVFVALLATYIYLHGSTRFEIFQPTPTSSTVQPIPIIPWEEYQKQMKQQQPNSQTAPSTSSESSSSSSDELTTEPAPDEESGSTSETTRQPLFPARDGSDATQPSDSSPAPESAPAQ